MSVGAKGIRGSPLGETTGQRRAEDVRVCDCTDADRIGSGRGRSGSSETEEVAVVARRDDRYDAGANDVRDSLDEDVRARIGLRATSREVDDVHPVAYGGLERGDDLRRLFAEQQSPSGAGAGTLKTR